VSADLKVTMYDLNGEGWLKPDYEGSTFYITDETKINLLAYGSLENGTYSAYCEYCFGEGSYYFRVASTTPNENIRWSFCNTNGTYSEELSFHIENGKCVPDVLLGVTNICEGSYSSVVTVTGTISLGDFVSEVFDSNDAKIFAEALAATVPGWELENIIVESSKINIRTITNKRSLSAFLHDVAFEVSFVPEIAYEYDGTSYYGVKELVQKLGTVLEMTFLRGSFASSIRTSATEYGVRHFNRVNEVQLQSLQLEEITYVGTKTLSLNTDFADEDVELQAAATTTAMIVEEESVLHVALFGAIVSLGVVAFFGVVYNTIRSYRLRTYMSNIQKQQQSEQDDDNNDDSFDVRFTTTDTRLLASKVTPMSTGDRDRGAVIL